MSDDSFIREVDEELRSDRVQDFWRRYGKIIITSMVALIIAIAAYRYYDYSQNKQAEDQGDAFMNAVKLADEGKADEAISALEELEKNGTPAYKAMARMRRAAELVNIGKKPDAVKEYDALAADQKADSNMRALARIRAALLLVDLGTIKEVEERVQSLTAPGASYRASALEAMGLAHLKANDLEKAFAQFESITQEEQAPLGLKQRASIMLNVIAAKGGPTVKQ